MALEKKLSLSIEPASWRHIGTRGNDVKNKLSSHVGENFKSTHSRKHFKT